ncbi:type VI secretion system TssO [Niabella beijingensis]|uniref:type VI secretion system TssO n=1 Tax=Niabella beijingensis TaxID=2872700 RepID=UPI001CBCBCC5|nr:type VI secretion system TssO [Niabella beijingensis]MBZ4188379.1 type VI secretion system transmembrane protein TssO [Niabella beijingensis]
MKPNNTTERSRAFARFLLFFFLTVALMVTAIFFGIRIPYAENEKLREQLAIIEKENRFRDNFAGNMLQTQSLLDTVNLDPARSGLIDGRITQKIQEMDALLSRNEAGSKDIYAQVIKALNNTQTDKKGLRAASSKDSVVAMYNAQIQELKNSLTKWQDSYKQLEMQNLLLRQK